MCEECSSFVIHLQQPADRSSLHRDLKSVTALLRSASTCDLCNLITGTEFNNTKDTIILKTCDPRYYLSSDQSYKEKAMTIGGRINLDKEISEVTVSISTNFGPFHAYLDVWESPDGIVCSIFFVRLFMTHCIAQIRLPVERELAG
jgi:hypothetical protein